MDGFSGDLDFQERWAEAGAVAFRAPEEEVAEELHFDLLETQTAAAVAASVAGIKRKARGREASGFGGRGITEEAADVLVDAEVDSRRGAGCFRKRGLIDHHDLIHFLVPFDRFYEAGGFLFGRVLADQLAVKDIADEGGFARTGNSRDGAEDAEREFNREVFDVVVGDAFEGDVAGGRAAFFRDGDGFFSREVVGGEGVFRGGEIIGGAAVEEVSARAAAAGADVHEFVGSADDGFLVLDDEEGVALVAEAAEDFDEARGVAGVKAHAGFVEDEEGVDERGAEAGGEVDALDFAAGERAGRAVEREVAEADAAEVGHAGGDLFVDELGGGVGVGDREIF